MKATINNKMPKKNIRYFLKDKLSQSELDLIPTSFDVIGSILIFIDFPKQLKKKEKLIGQTILDNLPHIKTVLKKTKKYSGRYRTPKYKVISGIKTKETTHKENNVYVKLNVEKVYYSPRTSTERARIASLIKKNESVLVMFSGSAVFPLVISRNSSPSEVYGIEINPTAHKYAMENIKKFDNVKLFKGNVKKVMPKLNKKFDRILMPLPVGAEKYLSLALEYIKPKGTIHFYYFSHERDLDKAKEIIKTTCKKSYRINKIVKCGQFGPGIFRYCFDINLQS